MYDAIQIMARLREIPDLDQRVSLFAEFLEAEFQYDGFTYGVGFDFSTLQALLSRFLLKKSGMNPEWMTQYTAEGLSAKDLTVLHAAQREGALLQSQIFRAMTESGVLGI